MSRHFHPHQLDELAACLKAGGVVAYPTEAVYGLGCDPHNLAACARLFALKGRPAGQGVLLIAADWPQIQTYIDLGKVPARVLDQIHRQWPGPCTWVFPRSAQVPAWICGAHDGIALRLTAHAPAVALCRAFGGALVSTSANPHGAEPARGGDAVLGYFGAAIDGVLEAPLGGLARPTTIRDALTGAIIRG